MLHGSYEIYKMGKEHAAFCTIAMKYTRWGSSMLHHSYEIYKMGKEHAACCTWLSGILLAAP